MRLFYNLCIDPVTPIMEDTYMGVINMLVWTIEARITAWLFRPTWSLHKIPALQSATVLGYMHLMPIGNITNSPTLTIDSDPYSITLDKTEIIMIVDIIVYEIYVTKQRLFSDKELYNLVAGFIMKWKHPSSPDKEYELTTQAMNIVQSWLINRQEDNLLVAVGYRPCTYYKPVC